MFDFFFKIKSLLHKNVDIKFIAYDESSSSTHKAKKAKDINVVKKII